MLIDPLIQQFLVDIARLSTERSGRASVRTAAVETWDFSGGDTQLDVTVDGAPQAVPILTAGFAAPTAALAAEVAVQISAGLGTGEAYVTPDGAVVVSSDTPGSGGSVEVTGGTANAILAFPTAAASGGGYDDVRGGFVPLQDGTPAGVDQRREHSALATLHCQVDRRSWGALRLGAGGVQEDADAVLTLNRRELAAEGLLYSTGRPRLNPGDRILRIRTLGGAVQEEFDDPGLYVHEVERAGFGLSAVMPLFNLVYLHCRYDRKGGGA